MMSDVMAKKATLSVQNKWVVGKINRAWLNHGEILVSYFNNIARKDSYSIVPDK